MPYLQWITSVDSMHIESKQCPQWVVLCWLSVGAMHIESVTMILNSYPTNILQHSINYWRTTCHTLLPNWCYFNNVNVNFIFIVTQEVEKDLLWRSRPPLAPRIAKPYIYPWGLDPSPPKSHTCPWPLTPHPIHVHNTIINLIVGKGVHGSGSKVTHRVDKHSTTKLKSLSSR